MKSPFGSVAMSWGCRPRKAQKNLQPQPFPLQRPYSKMRVLGELGARCEELLNEVGLN